MLTTWRPLRITSQQVTSFVERQPRPASFRSLRVSASRMYPMKDYGLDASVWRCTWKRKYWNRDTQFQPFQPEVTAFTTIENVRKRRGQGLSPPVIGQELITWKVSNQVPNRTVAPRSYKHFGMKSVVPIQVHATLVDLSYFGNWYPRDFISGKS
jgi:hypothetical protein